MKSDQAPGLKPGSVGRIISEPDGAALLGKYGIPYPEHALVQSAAEAESAAEGLGYPVVLKVVCPGLAHKSDVGGVVANLGNAGDLNRAYHQILHDVSAARPGNPLSMMVCRQAPEGVEVIVGSVRDPVFGSVIMFGLGGILAELLRDVTFRLVPLESWDAEDMIREIQGFPILSGLRGRPSCDLAGVAELLLSVSRLVRENPDLVELDLNPVRLYPDGLMALDVHLVENRQSRLPEQGPR